MSYNFVNYTSKTEKKKKKKQKKKTNHQAVVWISVGSREMRKRSVKELEKKYPHLLGLRYNYIFLTGKYGSYIGIHRPS